nr:unnamed protein product [Haemonchus contortus]
MKFRRNGKDYSKKASKKELKKGDDQPRPARSPPRSGKKHGKKDGEDSDNTLTDLPAEMPDVELERFEYRQQIIFDDQLL